VALTCLSGRSVRTSCTVILSPIRRRLWLIHRKCSSSAPPDLFVKPPTDNHKSAVRHVLIRAVDFPNWPTAFTIAFEAIGYETNYQYLLHDRDTIFARTLDESIANLGLRVLKSPPRSPRANAICERAIGTIRRKCLDWLIPISESHLRSILKKLGVNTTIVGVRICHSGQVSPIHPQRRSWFRIRARVIVLASASWCTRNRSSVGYIMTIHWWPSTRDRVFADHRSQVSSTRSVPHILERRSAFPLCLW
jgi:hypothetical protein